MNKANTYFKNIGFLLKNAKGILAVSAMLFIISGIIPYINVSAIAKIVEGAEKAITNSENIFNQELIMYIVILAITIFLDRLLMLAQMPLSTVINFRINTKINIFIAEKSASMEYSNLEKTDYQTKLQQVRKFSGNFPGLFNLSLNLLKSIITVFTLLIKFSGNYFLCLIVFVGIIPSIFISSKQKKLQHDLETKLTPKQRIRDYYSTLLTKSAYIKEKRLYNLVKIFLERWKKENKEIDSEYLKFQYRIIWVNLFSELWKILSYIVSVIILLYSISINAAIFISLSSAILYIQGAFSSSFSCFLDIRRTLLDVSVVNEFLYKNESIQDGQDTLDSSPENIEFSNVSFSYNDNEEYALKNINVKIKKGETIAIIGENGAGKTTFVKLLLGIYNPQQGTVLCNGVPVSKINRRNYLNNFACIFQNFNKYPFTIHQNINMFVEEDTPPSEEILKISERLNIFQWINQLGQGFNSLVTHMRPNGIELSGGQWQKLAIARAFHRKSNILIMDEPTASLDPLSEYMVFNEFISANESDMKIIVSHRVGITSKADKILMFKNGELIEYGDHKTLMNNNGDYADLYRTQAEWYTVDVDTEVEK